MPWTKDANGSKWVRYSHSSIAANGTNSSDWLDVAGFKTITCEVVHASHDDTSTWRIQTSPDGGTNTNNITGATATTTGASGATGVTIHPCSFRQIRLNISEADGNASSTLVPYLVLNYE